jgi:cholesterol oxidase
MDRKKFIKTSALAISGFYFLQSDLFGQLNEREKQ